jgi:hypothetical protein
MFEKQINASVVKNLIMKILIRRFESKIIIKKN